MSAINQNRRSIFFTLITMHTWLPTNNGVPRNYAVSGVYALRHMKTGRCYVGSSINCRTRIQRHLLELRNGTHFSTKLNRAWQKYGQVAFDMIILEEVPLRPDIIIREQYWIDFLTSCTDGFNLRPKADANWGMQWTPDQNTRRSVSNKIAWSNPILRAQLAQRFKGKKRGEWNTESHIKASETLKKRHSENPQLRLLMLASLQPMEIQMKRLERMRSALKKPEVYKKRVAQLREASKLPKRIANMREAAIQRLNLANIGIHSSADFDQMIIKMYTDGLSLRGISKIVGMDHKSIANRLRQAGTTITNRYAHGLQSPHKLTENEVIDIIERLSSGEKQSSIAKYYLISSSVISEINTGKAWKHIPRPISLTVIK